MSFVPLATLWAALVLGAATTPVDAGAGTLWMQVVLAALVLTQMIAAGVTKYFDRRWVEEDRRRDELDRRRVAAEIKEAARLEAERVAELAKETRTTLEKKLDENTDLTRKNNHHEEKIATALSAFDKLLDRMGATAATAEAAEVRKLLHEGGEGRTEAADSPPCP